MAPGGEMFRYPQHFGENVLPRGSHEWLPYSVDEVRLKCSNNNLPFHRRIPTGMAGKTQPGALGSPQQKTAHRRFDVRESNPHLSLPPDLAP